MLKFWNTTSINFPDFIYLIFIRLFSSFSTFMCIIRHRLPNLDAHCFYQCASKSITSFQSHTSRMRLTYNANDPMHLRLCLIPYLQAKIHLCIEIILTVHKYQLLCRLHLPNGQLHLLQASKWWRMQVFMSSIKDDLLVSLLTLTFF